MGALVRLWIREHRPFLVGAAVVVVAVPVTFVLMPLTWWCALWALASIPAIVHAATYDTSDEAKR